MTKGAPFGVGFSDERVYLPVCIPGRRSVVLQSAKRR
jgi:hypothetical protein